jgi:cytochrome c peroxidase
MEGVKAVVLVLFTVLLGTSMAIAMQQEASVEKGKALFNDPKLGTTGKSCNDCHPGGKGAEKAAAKNDIDRIVNACITHSIKGKALEVKSVEMQSIVLYIKSLVENPAAAPKKAPVGC